MHYTHTPLYLNMNMHIIILCLNNLNRFTFFLTFITNKTKKRTLSFIFDHIFIRRIQMTDDFSLISTNNIIILWLSVGGRCSGERKCVLNRIILLPHFAPNACRP